MTYKECSEKFPIGYSLGVFNIEEEQPTDFECVPTIEPGCAFWWAYNPIEKLFIFITFIFNSVIGYKTEDGQNFLPLQKDLSYNNNNTLYEVFPDSYCEFGVPIQMTDDNEVNLFRLKNLFREKMEYFHNYYLINSAEEFELALLHRSEYGDNND